MPLTRTRGFAATALVHLKTPGGYWELGIDGLLGKLPRRLISCGAQAHCVHQPRLRYCLTSLTDIDIAHLQALASGIFVYPSTMTADTNFLFTSGKITTPSTVCLAAGSK